MVLSDRLQLGRGAGQGLEAEGADLQQLELLCLMGKTFSLEGAATVWQSWPEEGPGRQCFSSAGFLIS